MHLVSGRQLLGTVREARDILLDRGVNGPSGRVLEAGTDVRRSIALGEREGEGKTERTRKLEGDRNGRVEMTDRWERRKEAGSSETEQAGEQFQNVSDNCDASGKVSRSMGGSPRDDTQRSGSEGGLGKRTENGSGDRSWEKPDFSREGSHNERPRDGNESRGNERALFATLELTQRGEVVGVAMREWVPLTESGTGSETAGDEGSSERIDCVSIYAVNREESSGPQSWDGRESAFRDWKRGDIEGEFSAQTAERNDGSAFRRESGPETDRRDDSGSGNRIDYEGGKEYENVHRKGRGHPPESTGTAEKENGNGNGNGKVAGDSHGTDRWAESGTGTEGFEGDGWAEDVERLGMRYRQPRLLARIFGLRDGRPSTDVFREGGAKTHMLLQHRTPLVRSNGGNSKMATVANWKLACELYFWRC